MITEHEALDRIAALLPEPSPLGGVDMIDADRVRAVLAEVTPQPCEDVIGELNDERVLHRKTRARLAELQRGYDLASEEANRYEERARVAEARLARIAALCDRVQPGWQQVVSVEAVRGILAEVTPDAGYEKGYRDGESNVAVDWRIAWEEHGPEGEVPSFREAAERLAARSPQRRPYDVRPATIDRDALLDIVLDEDMADAILALVRPVSGVTLTPEEAALAAGTLRVIGGPRAMALAARLEAAS